MLPCAGARGFLWVCRMPAQTVRNNCVWPTGTCELEGDGIARVVLVGMSRA